MKNRALASLRVMEKKGSYKKSFGTSGWENTKLRLVDSIDDVSKAEIWIFLENKSSHFVLELSARQMLLLEKVMGFKVVDGRMVSYDDKTLQELYYQGHPGFESLSRQLLSAKEYLLSNTYDSLSDKGIKNPVEHKLPLDIVYYFINNQKVVYHCNNLERDVACGSLGLCYGSDRFLSDGQLEEVYGLDDYDTLLFTLVERFSRDSGSAMWTLKRFIERSIGMEVLETLQFYNLSEAVGKYREFFDRDMKECQWFMSDVAYQRTNIVFKESLVDFLSNVTDKLPRYGLKGNKHGSIYTVGTEFSSSVFFTSVEPAGSSDQKTVMEEEEEKEKEKEPEKPMLWLDMLRNRL